MSVATAMARTCGMSGRAYDATIGASAQRSAQMPTGVDAISTLEPVKKVFSLPRLSGEVEGLAIRTQDPTRKLLYGQ